MTISFVYGFNLSFVMNLVEGVAFILVYSMFILSSRNQPRENKSYQLLRNTGIFGIVMSILRIARPLTYCLNCTDSEWVVARIYASSMTLLLLTPMLVCLGVSLFLVGKRNKETYGRMLIVSGIFWIVAFFGFAIGGVAMSFNMWMLMSLAVLSLLAFPAAILMIVHGAKFKDKYFVLAAIFYFLSLSAVFIVPWLPLPII